MLRLLIDEESTLSTSEWQREMKTLREILGDTLKYDQANQQRIQKALERVYNDNFNSELDLMQEDDNDVCDHPTSVGAFNGFSACV